MRLRADLSGAVLEGRVVVGEHLLQVHPEHGAVLHRATPGVRPVPRPTGTLPDAVPRGLAPLLGRDEELRGAHRTFGTGAPVQIVGEEGIGKSALLRRLAHSPSADSGEFADVVFLRVAGQPGEDILQSLFESFYRCDEAIVPTVAELKSYLRDLRGLVVLDDSDLARQELERVMGLAPHCVFAIGARERRLWGEGRSIALSGLDERSCLALAERELMRPLSEHERSSLRRLAAALEGHPLRIVQAAHLIFEKRGTRADRAAPSGSPKDQFDELMARSLEGEEEQVLGPLVALPGMGLSARRIADMTGIPDAPSMLDSLEERGLVVLHDGSYRLVGTGNAAIGRRVDAAGWRDRALEHFGRAAGGMSAAEAPAILALLDAGAKAGNQRAVIQLARHAAAPLALGTRWGAWREVLEHGLAAARELRDEGTEAWALHGLGSRAVGLGDARGGTALLEQALQLRERLGDEGGARLTRHNLELPTGAAPAPVARPPTPAPPAEQPPEPMAAPMPAEQPAAPLRGEPPPAPPREPWTPPAPQPAPAPARPPRTKPGQRALPRPNLRRPNLRRPNLRRPDLPRPDLPPLKPLIAVIAAVALSLLLVFVVFGGDEDSPSPREEAEKAADRPGPEERPTRRRTPAGGGRKLTALPAVIEPKALQFRAPLARLSRPLSVSATNKGTASITLGKVRLEGKDRGDFFATVGCNRTKLSRGESCKVVLSFVPARRPVDEAQTRTAVLILSDDGKGGRQTVPLTGSVVTP